VDLGKEADDVVLTDNEVSPYDELRSGLIMGRWKSGERLAPQSLKKELTCSSSVLRDALLQLAGEGLIVLEKNLGFRAVTQTPKAFQDVAHLRLLLELDAVALALEKGDFDWELNLSAAYQKLAHVEKQICKTRDVEKFVSHWAVLDWEFHSTLMSACGSEIMMRAYRLAFDMFRMHSVAAFPDFGFRWEKTTNEHKMIYEAAVERNHDACKKALAAHTAVYLEQPDTDEPTPRAKSKSKKVS